MYKKERKELTDISSDLIKIHRTQVILAIVEKYGRQKEMEGLDLQKLKQIIIARK